MSKPTPRFTLSPSRVARYYFHECGRHLRYASTTKEHRRAEGVPRRSGHQTPIAKAILEGGFEWEAQILADHLGSDAIFGSDGEPGAPAHERRHDAASTVAALAAATDGQVIYQGTLSAPQSFYDAYRLDPSFVAMVDCHPDLLWVVETPAGYEARVVDAKASSTARLAHRIQVGLYALILDHVLADAGLDNEYVKTRQGGVWLYGQPEPEWFDLSQILPPLETFLRHDLMGVLDGPASGAFWHLSRRCEWCDWYPTCRKEAEGDGNVSLVPALSSFAKRHLSELTPPVDTLDELARLLAGPGSAAALAGCASLEGKERSLALQVEAMRSGAEQPTGAASVAMPKAEHVMVILTLQSEPVQGHLYGYALRRAKGKALYGTGMETISRVSATGDDADITELRRELVRDLMAVLGPVDDWNRSHPEWREQLSVQVFVFDSYERDLLVEALLAAVADPEVGEDALALLFWFQRPELVDADDHPAGEVFFPVVVVSQVVRSLVALPVEVTYRLADVTAALPPSQYASNYQPSGVFAFHLSNRMKSDVIFSVWTEGKTERLDWIEQELDRRARAVSSVIAGLRERLDSTALFAWPPKFFLPPGLSFNHPILSRLAFVARYEAVLGYLDIRSRRGAPAEERLAHGHSIRLVARADGRFKVDGDLDALDIEASTYFEWILTGDTDGGRRARLAFDDFAFRDRSYAPRHLDLALAQVAKIGDNGVVEINLKPGGAFSAPAPKDVCTLERRFSDWLSSHLVGELDALDQETDPWFVRLVSDPVGTRQKLRAGTTEKTALVLAAQAGMTASQLTAFKGVLGHDVQLVWGPPGTGKTHFLATSVLALLEAAKRAGRPMRILVTAFTNTAINNLLAKIAELQTVSGLAAGAPVRKLGDGSGPVSGLGPKDAARFAADHDQVVLGATVWQARKVDPGDLAYDIVIVDEGSQLKVGEAAIALRRLRPGGRLVIAGDHCQLPPVISGGYPTADGEPPLARSILECLVAGDPDKKMLAALTENFRMCDALCAYPAASIYPAEYQPVDDEVAQRRLQLRRAAAPAGADKGTRKLIDAAVDPDYPLVLCVLEDVKATAYNPVEAALAAQVVAALRDRMPVADDAEFHDHGLFVVSPHHAQIRAIRRSLTSLRAWAPLPQVDTVDKTQGQERDAVVISYGVSDVEYALGEREFIYSRNRLNVAITRARKKSIVFLSRRLLEPPIQALDHDDVANGVAFMEGLALWCEAHGPAPLSVLAGGTTVTILRAG